MKTKNMVLELNRYRHILEGQGIQVNTEVFDSAISALKEQEWTPCSGTVDIPDHEVMACDKYRNVLIGYLDYNDDQWLCRSDRKIMYDPVAWKNPPKTYAEEEGASDSGELSGAAEIYDWLVAKSGSEWDDAIAERVRGTKEDIKQYLFDMVESSRKAHPDEWDFGTESVEEVSEIDHGSPYVYAEGGPYLYADGGPYFYAYACYFDSHEDYTARIDTGEVKALSK